MDAACISGLRRVLSKMKRRPVVNPSVAADLVGVTKQRMQQLMEAERVSVVCLFGARYVCLRSLLVYAEARCQRTRKGTQFLGR